MGAVGLNFGSATSGQGFDVTNTVNQIVTNLQSVESPWKSQLTSLQSKDTALSSLGTQIAALSTDLQSLTDFSGTLAYKIGSSSNTNILTLSSASAIAVAGTHTIAVQNLAQTSSAASDPIGATDALSGSITFRIGTRGWQTVHVGDNSTASTLSGLASAVNSAGLDVAASVLTNADGSVRLSLVSRAAGSAGQITIGNSTNNPGSPTTLADSTAQDQKTGLGLTTIQTGTDATFTVDGVKLTSASNTVTNAIPGVTFQLLSAGNATADATPQTVQVVIDNDTSNIESAISTFVSDYNTVIKTIGAQEGKDSSGNPEPLYSSSILAQLQQGMLSAMSSVFGTNTVNSLIALGITASTASDGTITLDADKLGNVLNSNFDQVVLFFQDSESFGPTFAKTLHSLGSNDGANGGISLALSEDRRQEKMLNDNISKQEELIATQKTHLTAELSLANQILQSIPQMIQQVDEMYSAITGYHSSNNG